MAEILVLATERFTVCEERIVHTEMPCGKIVRWDEMSDHWWQAHRLSRPAPPATNMNVFVFPRVRHWPMDYYRWRFPWTDEGLLALDEIEESGALTFDELDALIRRQRYVEHRILNWARQ